MQAGNVRVGERHGRAVLPPEGLPGPGQPADLTQGARHPLAHLLRCQVDR